MSKCTDCGGEAISDYTLCEACATKRRDAVNEKYTREGSMTRAEIEQELEGLMDVEYRHRGHAVVDLSEDGARDAVGNIGVEYIAMSQERGHEVACISLDGAYRDEDDIASSLTYCGLYDGQ